MKTFQHELPQAETVFNLAGQTGADPARLIRERLDAERARREAAEYQRKMQLTLEACPGFAGCDPPAGPESRGTIVVQAGLAGEAAVYLKRRFHVAESLELSHGTWLTFKIASRRRAKPGAPKRRFSFAPPQQYLLGL